MVSLGGGGGPGMVRDILVYTVSRAFRARGSEGSLTDIGFYMYIGIYVVALVVGHLWQVLVYLYIVALVAGHLWQVWMYLYIVALVAGHLWQV